MAKKLSKRTNRLISVICLSVFIFSLVCVGFVGYSIYQTYQENQRLQAEYDKMQKDAEYINGILANTDDDGYYNVYSKDGVMVIYK